MGLAVLEKRACLAYSESTFPVVQVEGGWKTIAPVWRRRNESVMLMAMQIKVASSGMV